MTPASLNTVRPDNIGPAGSVEPNRLLPLVMRHALCAAALMFCFAVLPAAHSSAQSLPGGGVPRVAPQAPTQPSNERADQGPSRPLTDDRAAAALNADRQRAIVSDTNKLLRLVNELNAEVAAAAPDSLTSGQLRKVGQIEKLARDVQAKMKQTGTIR